MEKELPGRTWGEAQANRNDKLWSGGCITRVSKVYPDKFSLGLIDRDARGLIRGTWHFRYLPYQTGTYYPLQFEYFGVNPDSSLTCSFFTSIEGDIAGDEYLMLRDSAVVISIDSIDALGFILGTFSGTFVRVIPPDLGFPLDPASPDTFVFEDGKYRARVVD